jgi:hypothetical protein
MRLLCALRSNRRKTPFSVNNITETLLVIKYLRQVDFDHYGYICDSCHKDNKYKDSLLSLYFWLMINMPVLFWDILLSPLAILFVKKECMHQNNCIQLNSIAPRFLCAFHVFAEVKQ